ncbi:MAG: Rrf2 family transcriptional regulator [Bacteroidia bacterium]|nr:Rrf2 family transcriptional regulator [Bacteroidia bacterium]
MIFSKSFGYAIRGILYVTLMSNEKEKVQLNEISEKLSVPRHFLAKIMKRMVKEGILTSSKGPNGGFSINKKTISTKIETILRLTDGPADINNCVLSFRKCNATLPCPLHHQIKSYKQDLYALLRENTIADLLNKDKSLFIQSLSVI